VLAQGARDAVGMCAVHLARGAGALAAMADPKYLLAGQFGLLQDGSLAGFLKTKCPHLSVQLVQSSFRPILGSACDLGRQSTLPSALQLG